MDALETLETPETPLPESDSTEGNGVSWRVMGASVRGTSHAKTGQPCQDAFAWDRLDEGALVLAVADGAGSASLSDIGAEIASQAAVNAVRTWLQGTYALDDLPESGSTDPEPGSILVEPSPPSCERESHRLSEEEWRRLLNASLRSALEAVNAEAGARQVPARKLACTLILLIATPDLVIAAQVGDGAAVIEDTEGRFHVLTTPEHGEYLNQTTFLISPNALETVQFGVFRGPAAGVAAFSDGLQMLALKLPEGHPHVPFFAPLFRFAAGAEDTGPAEAELAAFLGSPRVTRRTDDDLTLVLAVREEAAP
ncbi:MAG: protein phosphatase 2C domain-containing protein [Armatimonadetes bacterium]|nr:protein phosphatase 2C domain-containing protein [Armatimonadota bacterium]